MIEYDEQRWKDSFIRNLKYLMFQKNYSVESLAERAHVGKSTLYYILSGRNIPSIKTIVNLSIALDVRVDDLIYYRWMYE